MKSDENQRGIRMFPLFVDIRGKRIVVAGGGKIAARRVKTLVEGGFGATVKVVSPEITPELEGLIEQEDDAELSWTRGHYDRSLIEDAWMVLACTSDEDINRQIYRDAHDLGILVNVASDRSLCDFHFPGILIDDDSVIAFNCGGRDHSKIRRLRDKLKACFDTRREKGNQEDI